MLIKVFFFLVVIKSVSFSAQRSHDEPKMINYANGR